MSKHPYDMPRPCDNCPFRREGGIRLRRQRAVDIVEEEGEFPCHKTTKLDSSTHNEEPWHAENYDVRETMPLVLAGRIAEAFARVASIRLCR